MSIIWKKLQGFFHRCAKYTQEHSGVCLAATMFFSLCFKLLAWYFAPTVGRDAALYCLMAQGWYENDNYLAMLQEFPDTGWILPGFVWCLKTLMVTGIPVEIVGVAFNIFWGVLIVPIGYGIAWEVTQNKKIAFLSAVFFAVHPSINDLAICVQRDILFLCLSGTVFWFAWAGIRRQKWSWWSISAGVAGVNFLVRYESIEAVPVLGIVLLVLVLKHQFPWKKALLFFVVWFGVFFIVFSVCSYGIGKADLLAVYQNYCLVKVIDVFRHFSNFTQQ